LRILQRTRWKAGFGFKNLTTENLYTFLPGPVRHLCLRQVQAGRAVRCVRSVVKQDYIQSRETPADLLRRDCGLPANPVEKG